MNRNLYRFRILPLCLAAAVLVSSCVNQDYVIDDVDTGIHLAPNGINLPLATIENKTLADLFGEHSYLIETEDGYYAVRYENSYSFSVDAADINIPSVGNIGNAFGNIRLDLDVPSFDFSGETDINGLNLSREGSLPFNGTVDVLTPPITGTITSSGGEVKIDFGLPEEVAKINTVWLGPDSKGTPVTISFNLGELQNANDGVTVTSLTVDMPARYKLSIPSVGTIGAGMGGGMANKLIVSNYNMGTSQQGQITFYIESLTLDDRTPTTALPAAGSPYEISFIEDFEYSLTYRITPKAGGSVSAGGQKPKVTLSGAPEFKDATFVTKAIDFKLDSPVEKALDYRVTGIPSTITKVVSVDFVDGDNQIVITADDLDLPYAASEQPNIKLTFPEALSLTDPRGNIAGNVLTAPFADFVEGYTLRLDKIEFGDDGVPSGRAIDMGALGYKIIAEVNHTFPSRSFRWSEDIKGRDVPSVIDVAVNASGLSVASVHVELDFDFDQYLSGKLNSIDLSDLTDELGDEDQNPDLLSPTIVMEVTNSAGVTVTGDLTLNPKDKAGNTLGAVNVNGLTIEPSSTGGTETTYIFIAEEGTTPPDGYEPYYPQNFRNLFNAVPTTIDVELSARAAAGTVHTIPINADLPFSLDYRVDMPLAFGDGMDMIAVITEDGLNKTFSDLADMNVKAADIAICVGLEVSFPLKTEAIEVALLTADGNPIPRLMTTVTGKIEGPVGSARAQTHTLSINMIVPEGGDFNTLSEIDQLTLRLPITGTGTENRLKPTDYIKGSAWISLSNGISADLDEL